MVPGPVGPEWDDYNYEQSSARMPIEQAWGEVIKRWGILWRPLQMAFSKRAQVNHRPCRLIVLLHKFFLDASQENDIHQSHLPTATHMQITAALLLEERTYDAALVDPSLPPALLVLALLLALARCATFFAAGIGTLTSGAAIIAVIIIISAAVITIVIIIVVIIIVVVVVVVIITVATTAVFSLGKLS